jgi:hypothetical protein
MATRCERLFTDLDNAIELENDQLVMRMTDSDTSPSYLCIEKNSTYQRYGVVLGGSWERIIGELRQDDQTCARSIETLENAGKMIYQNRELIEKIRPGDIVKSLQDIDWESVLLQNIARSFLDETPRGPFVFDSNMAVTLRRLAYVILKQCQCQLPGLFRTIVSKYRRIYYQKIVGKTHEEALQIIRADYVMLKDFISKIAERPTSGQLGGVVLENAIDKLVGLYSFSIESELNNLIPSELGSMKDFFVKVISHYYSNPHPIIWAQIFHGMTTNLFKELPHTKEQLFGFASNQLLLNSGPFILKILQLIRPVLSPELAKKYGLSNLKYPLMSASQVDTILSRVVNDWDKYVVIGSFSASVGHVVLVHHISTPDKPFIIKMPKPLSIAQSCWEWNTMKDLFPPGCEREFILNILRSNGREFNVNNEIANIERANKLYTTSYVKAFNKPIRAFLTTVANIPDIIRPTWCAMTMTLAPGLPLSRLVENDELLNDTVYRAKLHRCLDLLVYKFFGNVFSHGFYHGDLHAGNIFFSFEKNQMTLIDFGAVGEIDVLDDTEDMRALMEIIVMSLFNNYPEILDKMTILLNKKCSQPNCDGTTCQNQIIDTNSDSYKLLHQELEKDRVLCYQYRHIDKANVDSYSHHIMSDDRISLETLEEVKRETKISESSTDDGIYHYLNLSTPPKETVIENRNVITDDYKVKQSESVGFNEALEKIIKYYALSGVNIAIKLNEFYEFQKAYALLLGVLHKVGYNGYRTGIFIKKCILTPANLKLLFRVKSVVHVISIYNRENKTFKEFKQKMINEGVTQY